MEDLKAHIKIVYVLGGLAADTDTPMPVEMQQTIRETWLRIQQEVPGTEFNYDFWIKCQPRRSTYPACRAVLAAGMQDDDFSSVMLSAIQKAYYLYAKNPSDLEVLIGLAESIDGLDAGRFAYDIESEQCEHLLRKELELVSDMGVSAFPSLVLDTGDELIDVPIDYTDGSSVIALLSSVLGQDLRKD